MSTAFTSPALAVTVSKNMGLGNESSWLSLLSFRPCLQVAKARTKAKRRLCDDMRTFGSAEYRGINRFVASTTYR